MKKTILYIFLSAIFLISPINAEEKKKMTDEEFFRIMDNLEERQQKAKNETLVIEQELESARKVNEKMDEVLNILSKENN